MYNNWYDFFGDMIPNYPKIPNCEELYKLGEFNSIYSTKDNFKPHQLFVARFLSPVTPYKALLVNHTMGSGKTCSVFLTMYEFWKYDPMSRFIVLTPSESQKSNFKNEIAKCINYLKCEEIEKIKISDYLKNKVTYTTHSRFNEAKSKSLTHVKVVFIDEAHMIYLDKLIDSKDEQSKPLLYKSMCIYMKELHKHPNIKVVLLTGTPITNHYSKLFQLIDLLIYADLGDSNDDFTFKGFFNKLDPKITELSNKLDPLCFKTENVISMDKLTPDEILQIPGRRFNQYIIPDNIESLTTLQKLKLSKEFILNNNYNMYDEIKKRFERYISTFHMPSIYVTTLSGNKIEFVRIYKGEEWIFKDGTKSPFKVFVDSPKEYQLTKIIESYNKFQIKKIANFYWCVLPESLTSVDQMLVTVGTSTTSFNENIEITYKNKKDKLIKFFSNPEFLSEHSILYWSILNEMGIFGINVNNQLSEIDCNVHNEAVFFFNDKVQHIGNKLFTAILKLYGFKQIINIGDEESYFKKKELRFAIISTNFGSTTSNDIDKIVKIFSDPRNRYGEYLRLILGSEKMAYGYNLINGRQIHSVLQWNSSIMEQAEYRIMRGKTNFEDPKDSYVKIYRHFISIPFSSNEDITELEEDIEEDEETNDQIQTLQPTTVQVQKVIEPYFEKRIRYVMIKDNKNAQILSIVSQVSLDSLIHSNKHKEFFKENYTKVCNFQRSEDNFPSPPLLKPNQIKSNNQFNFYIEDYLKTDFFNFLQCYFQQGVVCLNVYTIVDLFKQPLLIVLYLIYELIQNQTKFLDRYGIQCYIIELNDAIILSKDIHIKTDGCKLSELKPYELNTLSGKVSKESVYEAYMMKNDLEYNIKNFSMNHNVEAYKKLSIFTRLFIFEKYTTESNELTKFLVEEAESDNILLVSEMKNLDKEHKDLLNISEIIMFHKIKSDFHTEKNTSKKRSIPIEGLRCFKKGKWVDCTGILSELAVLEMQKKMVTTAPESFTYWLKVDKDIIKFIDGEKNKKGLNCQSMSKDQRKQLLGEYLSKLATLIVKNILVPMPEFTEIIKSFGLESEKYSTNIIYSELETDLIKVVTKDKNKEGKLKICKNLYNLQNLIINLMNL